MTTGSHHETAKLFQFPARPLAILRRAERLAAADLEQALILDAASGAGSYHMDAILEEQRAKKPQA